MSTSFLYSPNDSPTSESFDEAEDVLRAYEVEQRDCTHTEREPDERASSSSSDEYSPRMLRKRTKKRRSQSSTMDTRNRLSDMLRRHDELAIARSIDTTATSLPVKPHVGTPRDSQNGTKSFSLYRLSPMQARSLSGAVSNNYSAPDLSTEMRDSEYEQASPTVTALEPQTLPGHYASTIYMIPDGKPASQADRKDSGNGHRRVRSLSPVVPPTPPAPSSRLSLYPTPAHSPSNSTDGIPQVKSLRRGFQNSSTSPLTPPHDMDSILPLPWIRKSRSLDANILLDLGMDDGIAGKKRRSTIAPTGASALPVGDVSRESGENNRVQSPLPEAPSSRIVTPEPSESPQGNIEEMQVQSKWSDESSSDEVVPKRTKSKDKKKKNEKAKVTTKAIPKIKTKSRPITFVPAIPSLPVKSLPAAKSFPAKEKWDVKKGVSGLFHKRMFNMNRMEVREIIDTSFKNPFSTDPGRRYSRAGEADIPMLMTMEGSDGTPGPRKALKTLGLIDKNDWDRSRTGTPEPGSFTLNSVDEDLNQADDEAEPAIDITRDLAMAVAEEETALSIGLRSRAMHRTVDPLPSIPEMSPNLERSSCRFSTMAGIVANEATTVEGVSPAEFEYSTAINTPLPLSPRTSEEFPATTTAEQSQQPPRTPPQYPLSPRTPPPQQPLPPPPSGSPPRNPSPPRSGSPPRNLSNLYHKALVRLSLPPSPPSHPKKLEVRKPPGPPIDFAAYQVAISGPTSDHLMAGFSPAAAISSSSSPEVPAPNDAPEGLEDWIRSYDLHLGGMVSEVSAAPTRRPSVVGVTAWEEEKEDAEGDPVCPALEDDHGSGSSKRSSSSTGPPDIEGNTCLTLTTTTSSTTIGTNDEAAKETKTRRHTREEKAKMGCNLNDETLGVFLSSWEAAGAVSPVSPE